MTKIHSVHRYEILYKKSIPQDMENAYLWLGRSVTQQFVYTSGKNQQRNWRAASKIAPAIITRYSWGRGVRIIVVNKQLIS